MAYYFHFRLFKTRNWSPIVTHLVVGQPLQKA